MQPNLSAAVVRPGGDQAEHQRRVPGRAWAEGGRAGDHERQLGARREGIL